jgi:hypothetical protein
LIGIKYGCDNPHRPFNKAWYWHDNLFVRLLFIKLMN